MCNKMYEKYTHDIKYFLLKLERLKRGEEVRGRKNGLFNKE